MGLNVGSLLIGNRQFMETSEKSTENPLLRDAAGTHQGGFPSRVRAARRDSWLLWSPVLISVVSAVSSIKSSM